MIKKSMWMVAAACSVLCAAMESSAAAQIVPTAPTTDPASSDPVPSDPVPSDRDPGDIVVTAQKRETTVQKTAVAISVFDKETLARNGVQNIQDLSKLAPSVSLGQSSANVIITVRGVSSRDTNEIADPAISVSTDEFSIQRPTGLSDSIYDLDRVEVLRGPQGTLYGRSATGGAINFITAKPVDRFEARLSAGYGNFNAFKTEGMLNVPLSDTLAIRGSFATNRRDGYRTNEDPARAGDDADAASGRLHVLWKPTRRLKILLTGQYTHLGGVGPTNQGYAYTTVNTNYRPNLDQDGTPHSLPNQYLDTTIKSVQGQIDYDLDFATLMYIGGYRDMQYHQLRDLDGTTNSTNYYQPNENPRDQQHELRLVSNGSGRFKWQIGGTYFKENNTLLTYYQSYAVANAPLNRFIFSYDVLARSEGIFGQASYELVDNVTAEGGIRYSHDYKTRSGFQNLGSGNQPQPGEISSNKVTYHTGLNWQATPRNLLYAKYDTGYKPGGFTTVFGVGNFNYTPETISAVEVGSKNRFLDNKLTLNLSGFDYQYKNQQVSVVNNSGGVGTGTTYVINAGKSHIYGAELEALYLLTPADRWDLSVSYLHARFTDLCTSRGANNACLVDRSGNVSVQAPTWQINTGYQHDFALLKGTLTPRVQTHYESRSYLGIENYQYQRQGKYSRTDLLLTYTAPDGKWSLEGYVRNLENSIVITAAAASFGSYNFFLAAPRTYGGRLTFNW